MRKILFVMVAALTLVACEKNDSSEENLDDLLYNGSGYVKLSQNSVIFDKQTGGVITIEAEEDAFVSEISKITGLSIESGQFYKLTPPDYILTLEQILKYKQYVVDGCKVVPNGYRKFTITIEPNCDCDYLEIAISKFVETKKYGTVAGRGAAFVRIELK